MSRTKHHTSIREHRKARNVWKVRSGYSFRVAQKCDRMDRSDILLDKGLIKQVGSISPNLIQFGGSLKVLQLNGSWVTPGIVDMHSHIGSSPSPGLSVTNTDDVSFKGPVVPWLRIIDTLNTHHDAYLLAVAGGVTTSLVLPGSVNAIGGQAFPIKLRKTSERSSTSMLVKPDTFNISSKNSVWRHLKQACGENLGQAYGNSRMDTYWAVREAYNKAKEIRDKQDEFCARVEAGIWKDADKFPKSLQWEVLVDVLRGKVKVHNHCYEAVDFDAMIRITNEFQFHIAAFHHAHEAYLIPDLLKKTWGGTPAIAMFAVSGRYKREAYRGSEFAPGLLADEDIKVVIKSDHPGIDSRYVLFEAQQAHYYGLKPHLAISSVISTPARVMGLDHRIGFVKEGFDADLVIWDSHPLTLGATPLQVYIDGIAQLQSPSTMLKPKEFQSVPRTPDFSERARAAVDYDGLPPLPYRSSTRKNLLFVNVKNVWRKDISTGKLQHEQPVRDAQTQMLSVLVENGNIVCVDTTCKSSSSVVPAVVDLKGGSINPGLLTYGYDVGLQEMTFESSTNDGYVQDPLTDKIAKIMGGSESVVRAVDGLAFGGRNMLFINSFIIIITLAINLFVYRLSYSSGITHAITPPSHSGFLAGLSTAFSLSAKHKLEKSAIVQNITALHVGIHPGGQLSVSSQVMTLRHILLSGDVGGELGQAASSILKGELTLVVEAESADIIASLISLKAEVESKTGESIKLTISGGTEAHILARELSDAGVGVIIRPARPYPAVWEEKRIMAGPPLTPKTSIEHLLDSGVTVGIGCGGFGGFLTAPRNLRFDLGWVALDSHGRISKEQAFEMGSSNLERLLGLTDNHVMDLVATRGADLLSMEGEVVGVISPTRGLVELF